MWLPPSLEALSRRLFPDLGRRAVAVKAVTFAIVGVINAAVDLGVFSLCYFYVGCPIILANVISWFVAVTGSYVMNSMTTFAVESGRKLHFRFFASFLSAQVAGFLASTAIVYLVPMLIGRMLGNEASITVLVLIAKVFAIGASFVVNFSLSHFLVFRHREINESPDQRD